MKKVLFISILALTAVFLSARGQDEFQGRTFAATYMTLNNSFFVALDDSIREHSEKDGNRLLSYNPRL